MAFRSRNPVLNSKTFTGTSGLVATDAMTVPGTVNKTGILLLCVLAAATWTWNQAGDLGQIGPIVTIGAIGGFIVAMVTVFKQQWAPITAPVYAVLEGLVIGGLSAILETRFHGIA